jgi:tetratricopeptide (TPR) repeat protein
MNRIEKIKTMLLATPNDSFLLYALALEYIKLENEEEAVNLFLKIVATNENYSGVYYHLGKLQEKLADKEQAMATYKKGIIICQQQREMHNLQELQSALNNLEYGDD